MMEVRKYAPRLALMLTILMAVLAVPLVKAEDSSVTDYAIIDVMCTAGSNVVTVRVQALFCSACNPNTANNPGCPIFTHGYPGPPPYSATTYWCGGVVDGRYAAVQVRDTGGTVLGSAKMVLNLQNWPLGGIEQRLIDVTISTTLSPGDTVVVEADLYCSWCGHYYPAPVRVTVTPPHGAPEFPLESLEVLLPALAFLGLRLKARGRKTE